ncbi:hypothetical protein [Victivallis vadensis]|uniref:hypothetical protein n=1 Tax=Victivallis vadensis TaxID=172901 RepID=UPI002063A8B3|nr:hypothetical protein [uncultured Victivallis sp.]DAU53920.1 MAG TPA: hypothetical protein [Caudoviricetes sp.]
MTLTDLAKKHGYSRELQRFLGDSAWHPWNEADIVDAIRRRQPERDVLAISLRPVKEGTFETEAEARAYFAECDQAGEEEYRRHCGPDGKFRFADFSPPPTMRQTSGPPGLFGAG